MSAAKLISFVSFCSIGFKCSKSFVESNLVGCFPNLGDFLFILWQSVVMSDSPRHNRMATNQTSGQGKHSSQVNKFCSYKCFSTVTCKVLLNRTQPKLVQLCATRCSRLTRRANRRCARLVLICGMLPLTNDAHHL